jgi:dinuclear metal center YbgI/SA1388 family protein
LLEELFPKEYSDSWDNSGGQIFNFNKDIKKIVVALDVTDELINLAVENKVDLIISHHPIFFEGIKEINIKTYKGQIIKDIIDNEINIYSMHTNFDMANQGMTKLLTKKLGCDYFDVLKINDADKNIGYGGVIDLGKDFEKKDVLKLVKEKLEVENFKLLSNNKKTYRKLSICGGSGGDFLREASQISDIYVTGDIKYHEYQLAYELGLDVIDIGHYNSEKFFMNYISDIIKRKSKEVDVDIFDRNVFESIII